MYRPLGYIPTDEEWSYVDRDTIIVAMAIREKLEKGMHKMTLGSDAYYNFKRRFSRKQFDYLFPILPLEDWQYIKKAYKVVGLTPINDIRVKYYITCCRLM